MEIYKADIFPSCIDVAAATQGFDIEKEAARMALESPKTRHARRWQTKEGTYRVKQQYPPDVRDGGDVSMGDARLIILHYVDLDWAWHYGVACANICDSIAWSSFWLVIMAFCKWLRMSHLFHSFVSPSP